MQQIEAEAVAPQPCFFEESFFRLFKKIWKYDIIFYRLSLSFFLEEMPIYCGS